MLHYFKFVCGAELDGSVSEKTEILGNALKLLEQKPNKNMIMIGDRKHDIIAANLYGISSAAVLYGYGTKEELQKENPTHIVNTVSDLSILLLLK
jgi:phosphoglycolate phosphatase